MYSWSLERGSRVGGGDGCGAAELGSECSMEDLRSLCVVLEAIWCTEGNGFPAGRGGGAGYQVRCRLSASVLRRAAVLAGLVRQLGEAPRWRGLAVVVRGVLLRDAVANGVCSRAGLCLCRAHGELGAERALAKIIVCGFCSANAERVREDMVVRQLSMAWADMQ